MKSGSKHSLVLILLLTSVALPAATHAKDIRDCGSNFRPHLQVPAGNPDWVYANDVMVTGELFYPLDLVLADLSLSDSQVKKLKGKTVLSVAEGFSGLLPHLGRHGADAWGLDLWYSADSIPENETGKRMKKFIAENEGQLIAGNALDMPVLDHSVDLLVSHQLVNNLLMEKSMTFLEEAFRVLAPGGEARVFGFDSLDIETVKARLLARFGSDIEVSSQSISKQWVYLGKKKTMTGQLLIFRRASLDP
ncbi:MAG: methyltransferase domain-containing protein [Bdellovibrionales bacterium]|nr:methyltransferase domain-containing protein [Bdellovibrionales bacterium]